MAVKIMAFGGVIQQSMSHISFKYFSYKHDIKKSIELCIVYSISQYMASEEAKQL